MSKRNVNPRLGAVTYTTGTAHGDTSDTANLLETDTLEGLAGLALSTRSHLVGSVDICAGIIRVKLLDVKVLNVIGDLFNSGGHGW